MTASSVAPMSSSCDEVDELSDLDQELSRLEADWVNLEFEAIIAANFNDDVPPPPKRPTSRSRFMSGKPDPALSSVPNRLRMQTTVGDRQGRQRSPPPGG